MQNTLCNKSGSPNDHIKSFTLPLLAEWKANNVGKRVSEFHLQIGHMLELLNYDPRNMNRSMYEKIRAQYGWTERHRWPLTAWNRFCEYGIQKMPHIFSEKCQIIKSRGAIMARMPDSLYREITEIIDSHIVRSTSVRLKNASQVHILRSMEILYNYVVDKDKLRQISNLGEFKVGDIKGFQSDLLKSGISPLSNQVVSSSTLAAFLVDIKRVFVMGFRQGKLSHNLFTEIYIEKIQSPKREFCLSKEQVERLRTVGNGKADNQTLKEQFEKIRNNAMISVQYEGALRAEEVVKLCWEDLPRYERSKANVGPIIVRGSKARHPKHEDRVYILFDRVDLDLLHWREISRIYCDARNMAPPAILREGKEFHPIFFSINGDALSPQTYISSIFSTQISKAKISLPKGYKTHILRHSRITHWVDDGYPFEKIHENARHSDLKITWRYFHGSAKKRIEIVEKMEKVDHQSSTLKTSILPSRGILRSVLDAVLSFTGHEADDKYALYAAIEKDLQKRCEDFSDNEQYYTFREVMDRWGVGRTQTWGRLKMTQQQGLLAPVVVKRKYLYPRQEIDHITTLVDSRKASIAFGYNEKVPTTIPGLANKGVIRSKKIGRLHFFEPSELVDHFYSKNSK